MTPSHKIKNAVFDLRFSSKAALLQENSSLGGFVKQRLMPVVDEVLSENALEDHVIYIDKLKINLGSVRLDEFKSQMERLLRTKLDTLLKSKIQSLHYNSGTQERIVPLTKRNLELIQHFLITGTLPGALNLKYGGGPERCLQSVLVEERSDFLRFLQNNSHRPQIIKRLVRQFSEEDVKQLVRLLVPSQSETALKAVDNILRRNQSRSPTGMQSAAFTELVWELLLGYLLQNPDSRFIAAKFINWINAKLEQRQGSIPETLTAILAEKTDKQVLQKHLTSRSGRSPKTIVPGKESRQIFKAYDLYEALRFFLQHGILPWSAGNIAPDISVAKIIEELKSLHPEKLLKFAKDLQYGPDLCQNLAEKLTPAEMKEFITTLLTVSPQANDKDRLTFIQSITDYADRAADCKGFLADIIRNLVTRQPIDLKQLAARPGDPAKTEPADAAFNPGHDPDLIRAHLTTLLNTANKTEAHVSTLSRLINDLETKYPSEYRDYLAWLVANKKQFASFLRLTSPQKFKQTLARLAGFPSAERTIELLEKVFSTEVPSKFSNRAAILRTLARLIITTTLPKTPDESLSTDKPTPEDESALIRYLTAEPTSHPIADAATRAIFKGMIHHGSDTLYATLSDHLKNKGVRKKIITLLSEDWLGRVLAGLRPDMHLPVQTYADIIADACYSKEVFDRPEKINTLKWEFIFTYLAQAENRPFHHSDFIRRFTVFLADNIPKMDKGTITAVLSQNLTANIKPATRPGHITALQELDHLVSAIEDLKKSALSDKETTEDVSALIGYLTGDQNVPPISDGMARAIFKRKIHHGSDTLFALLRDHLEDKGVRKKMITLLSENWLTRVLAGLRPNVHLPVQTYADIISEACYSKEVFDRPEKMNTLKWEFIFAYLSRAGNRAFHQGDFIRRFIAVLADNFHKMDKGTFTDVLSQNLTANNKCAPCPEHLTVLRELGHLEDATGDLRIESPAGLRETAEDPREEVAVPNAGMVIAAPYLPRLWKMLELLEGGQFKDSQAAERAAHLLQFMTDENTESPEYQLVLNKILCGVKSNEPIAGRIDIIAKEREAIEGLIRGMIENWKTIGQTSVAGFRESFFQRRGRLTLKEDAWHLKVEQRTFDMLLDSIPWGFATIKHPWMERVLYVKWR